MKLFHLERNEDETGISGVGIIAEGAQFADGRCVMCWLTVVASMGFYHSVEDIIAIHGHGGKTVLIWDS